MLSVGIIMRTKNRAVLLKRALESVLNQTYSNWHLIVINDGGDPVPVNNLLELHRQSWQGRMQVVHSGHAPGLVASINLGLKMLDTDLVVIHDDDDSWSPDFLTLMTNTYQEKKRLFPNLGGITCHTNLVTESVEGNILHTERVDPMSEWMTEGFVPFWLMFQQDHLFSINYLYDLATCKEIGMYDENLSVISNYDFNIRFLQKKDIWVLPQVLAFVHQRNPLTSNDLKNINTLENKYQLYRGYLENKWLREELESGKKGIGSMVMQFQLFNMYKK